MKRFLALAAAAATLVTALPAQAAVDPAAAMKRQFVPGHGVRISETLRRSSSDPLDAKVTRIVGSVEFGRSGPVAADLLFRMTTKGDPALRVRMIFLDGRLYMQATGVLDDLPMGKTWVLMSSKAARTVSISPVVTSQPADVLAPEVLKALVSHAKSSRGGRFSGSITNRQARALKSYTGFDYRLGLDSKGLPARVDSTWTSDIGGSRTRDSVETRFSDWGSKITVKAPPEDEVITTEDANDALWAEIMELIKDIPDGSANSLGKIR